MAVHHPRHVVPFLRDADSGRRQMAFCLCLRACLSVFAGLRVSGADPGGSECLFLVTSPSMEPPQGIHIGRGSGGDTNPPPRQWEIET